MQDKKSIALFIPSLSGGGAERVFVNLSNFFVENGHDVCLLTSKGGVYSHLLNKKVKLHYITRSTNVLVNYVIGVFQIFHFILKYKYDYLLCTLDESNIIGGIAKKITGKKIKLITRQARTLIPITNYKEQTYRMFLKKSFRSANIIIANSPDTASSLSKYINIKHEKINVIGNPIYNEKLIQLSVEPITHKWIDLQYIIAVGSLREEKGFETLITAFSYVKEEFKELKLIILGTGPLLKKLQHLVKLYNLEHDIDFVGFIANPYPFYKKASLLVSSSIIEGFGNVLIEALSMGTPIVSTACSGPKYILADGAYGEIIPINNPNLMAKAIKNTLNDLHIIDRQLLKGRAMDFSIDIIGKSYLNLLK